MVANPSTVMSVATTNAAIRDALAAEERRDLVATIAFWAATRRAMRENLRGLPNDST